jgi:hypothetical protein
MMGVRDPQILQFTYACVDQNGVGLLGRLADSSSEVRGLALIGPNVSSPGAGAFLVGSMRLGVSVSVCDCCCLSILVWRLWHAVCSYLFCRGPRQAEVSCKGIRTPTGLAGRRERERTTEYRIVVRGRSG